jgi:spermidine synthase
MLLEVANLELVLLGNLRPNGILLHVARSSWWTPDALKEAMGALKRYVLEWHHRVGLRTLPRCRR